jgi:hypothetical protein
MRTHVISILAGLSLLSGCVGGYDPTPSAELQADPSILIMELGDTTTVTVEAFVGNEPESVRWSLGTVGNGLAVSEDTTYGRVYIGGHLALPTHSHSRRYEVTVTDTTATFFVVGGGTASLTIPVNPAP